MPSSTTSTSSRTIPGLPASVGGGVAIERSLDGQSIKAYHRWARDGSSWNGELDGRMGIHLDSMGMDSFGYGNLVFWKGNIMSLIILCRFRYFHFSHFYLFPRFLF